MNMINAPEKVLQLFHWSWCCRQQADKTSPWCGQTTQHYLLEVRNLGISYFYMEHTVVSKFLIAIGGYYSNLLISHSYTFML